MKYFVTGHTGFKGSWYALKLLEKGHEVFGYSLDPLNNGHFDVAQISKLLERDVRGDIRDLQTLRREIEDSQPDVIVHLAAQPLVSTSYENPSETFEINVGGTLNVLKASSEAPSVKAIAVITTDKVYENVGRKKSFVETDSLGLGDPYSTSKAMADLLTQSWMKSLAGAPIGIFRAGNVIGGGDVSPFRLIPDIIKSQELNKAVQLRKPTAVRPWQHVLDCLEGYQKAIDWMLENKKSTILNFGPHTSEYRTVAQVAQDYIEISGRGSIEILHEEMFSEAEFLLLDSTKARSTLNWTEKLSLKKSLSWTHEWYSARNENRKALDISMNQIRRFESTDNVND